MINGMNFTLLFVDPNHQIIRLVRTDYKSGNCLKIFMNTTLNSEIFDEYAPGTKNLTVMYGCSRPKKRMPGELSCKVADVGVHGNIGYYEPGIVGTFQGDCRHAVVVPIQEILEPVIPTIGLNEVIMKGFDMHYHLRDQDRQFTCEDEDSRGYCGYNHVNNHTVCFCLDGNTTESKCLAISTPTLESSSRNHGEKISKMALIIGLCVGGGLIAFLVSGFSFLFVVRIRKQPEDDIPSNQEYPVIQSALQAHHAQSILSTPSPNSNLESDGVYLGLKLFFYDELEEATHKFHKSQKLGHGGFGVVYYGRLRDGREVAVKRFYEHKVNCMGQYMNEVAILAGLRHKNLVTLYGCTPRKSKELLLVYEFVSNGTIADHLHGKYSHSNKFSWKARVKVAVETAEALNFLHVNDVVHRDVKTPNILLDHNFQVKVADFGLARLFPENVTHMYTLPQGTPGYVDPQYHQDYKLTSKSDVYSFGVVLAELISSEPAVNLKRHPNDLSLAQMAVDRIQRDVVDDLVDPNLGYSEDYVVRKMVNSVARLAFQCLDEDRQTRPSMSQVLESLIELQKEQQSEASSSRLT